MLCSDVLNTEEAAALTQYRHEAHRTPRQTQTKSCKDAISNYTSLARHTFFIGKGDADQLLFACLVNFLILSLIIKSSFFFFAYVRQLKTEGAVLGDNASLVSCFSRRLPCTCLLQVGCYAVNWCFNAFSVTPEMSSTVFE